MDNNLVLPEYLVEFDYIQESESQNKVSDFGDQIGILDNPEDEFISPKNFHIYKAELSNIYNTLCDEISNYQFENIEDTKHPNLEIKAQDLDRADISLIKITLLNYFKYCLSRSFLYELNPNLLQEALPQDVTDQVQHLWVCLLLCSTSFLPASPAHPLALPWSFCLGSHVLEPIKYEANKHAFRTFIYQSDDTDPIIQQDRRTEWIGDVREFNDTWLES